MNGDPGTYALVFECVRRAEVDVGRLGTIRLEAGYYVYVGSALGPGGVKARVLRHWRPDKRQHWHIDYVGAHLRPHCAWYLHGTRREEHRWAQALISAREIEPVPGFGASDCACRSHFFRMPDLPVADVFARIAGPAVRCAFAEERAWSVASAARSA